MKTFVGSVVALALLVSPLAASATDAATRTLIVYVTIHGHPQNNPYTPAPIFFVPDRAKAGTIVTFKITNVDTNFHDFTINGVTSRAIGPLRGKAIIKVDFKRRGDYIGAASDHGAGIGGQFVVT